MCYNRGSAAFFPAPGCGSNNWFTMLFGQLGVGRIYRIAGFFQSPLDTREAFALVFDQQDVHRTIVADNDELVMKSAGYSLMAFSRGESRYARR
jgi:hypothetical protein